MTTEEDGNTLDGTPPERFAPELERRGATVIGVNCSVGPAPMLETIERMAAVDAPAARRRSPTPASRATSRGATSICARPSTWRPTRAASSCTTCASSAAAAGRRPSTSGRSRRRCAALAPAAGARAGRRRRGAARRGAGDRPPAPPVPREQKSRLAHALARGTFVVGVELLPPRGYQAERGDRARARAEDPRRRRRQHPRRPARRRADERAVARRAHRAAGRHRDAAALLLPRSEPARHPVGPARRARDGPAQPAAHHRRSGPRRRLSRTRPPCSTSIRSASPTSSRA